ncbi:hypothetical protein [Alkalihalobacillus trypoxylicola]|uniref:Uncharacterized protein n=1 Tax=Alkalihalobacillus trypoxylicola TaxID=519424 RepID=A0A161PLW8_9BACI|nr:hypothetical protein [Alkalihalobacillus trypoxylicola]KYG34963.1 hypothetical protein AZF04_01115 [Alkalihalobacillus trypoxylicola]
MKLAQRLWPWTAIVALIIFVVEFFVDLIWLDIGFNLSVALTVTLIAIEMVRSNTKNKKWVIGIVGFFVTVLLVEVIYMLWNIF